MTTENGRLRIGHDWYDYYQREASIKRFHPDCDVYETHRCRFALQLRLGMAKQDVRAHLRELAERLAADCGNALDVGCGDGHLSGLLHAMGITATGVDISLPRLARNVNQNPGILFAQSDLYQLPFTDRSFDTVFCIEVLEHTEHPLAALRELARLAARYVVVSVPYDRPIKRRICPHCGEEFCLDGHIQRFDLERMEAMSQAAGLRVELIRGYTVQPDVSTLSMRRRVFESLRGLLRKLGFIPPQPQKYLGVLGRPIYG
jgi:SAM-dependent methyltransferase